MIPIMVGCGLSRWFVVFLSLYLASISVFCTCPEDWQTKDNACFKVYNESRTWIEANNTCSSEHIGAHLIYMNGRSENYIDSLKDIQSKGYFVGASKKNGNWNWGNGVKVTVSIPSSGGIFLKLKQWDHKWEAVDGNHASYFICELNNITTAESSSVVQSTTTASASTMTSSLSSTTLLTTVPSLTSSSSSPSAAAASSSTPPSPLSSSLSSSFQLSLSLLSSSSSSSSSTSTSSTPPTPQAPPKSSSSFYITKTLIMSSTSVAGGENINNTDVTDEGSKNNLSKSGKDSLILSFIQNITKLDVKEASSLKESVDLMQNMLVAMEISKKDYSTNDNPLLAGKKLEEFALRYTEYHLKGSEVLLKRSNFVLQAKMVFPGKSDYLFEIGEGVKQDSKILLPQENFDEKGTSVVSIYYNNLDEFMNKLEFEHSNVKYDVKSKILSTSVEPKRNMLTKNATIGFKVPTFDARLKRMCVFWDFAITKERKDPGWSPDGCTLAKSTDEYVVCSCNHLTHFAVLMQVKDVELSSYHENILKILTYLGLTLSIIGCVMTFITYSLFTDTKSEQSQIRMNLVLVLAIAHILFLLGSPAKSHLILCISVAVMLQFFYTSALCWMFAEGIQLYMQVIKVFNANLKMKEIYVFAWGLPLILITVSLSIAGNGLGGLASFVNNEFCWLSVDNHLIWTFIAPVLLLILSNFIILGLVIKEMKGIKKPMDDTQRANVLRSSIKAFVVLAPLLGTTWLMGLLCILGAGVAGLYIFTILNSTQGLFIFVLHCLRNSEIRNKIQRKVQVFEDSRIKQESSQIHRRSKFKNEIFKPSTPNSTDNVLNVPENNIVLSELDSTDSICDTPAPPSKLKFNK